MLSQCGKSCKTVLNVREMRSQRPMQRRNGKLSACEPCRKRKLACDHELPVCGRCSRRGQGSQCKYDTWSETTKDIQRPSALTPVSRDYPPLKRLGPPVANLLCSPAEASNTPAKGFALSGLTATSHTLNAVSSSPNAAWRAERGSAPPSQAGFFGESSSSAAISELNNSLRIWLYSNESSVSGDPHRSEQPLVDGAFPDHLIERGIAVLTHRRDLDLIRGFFERWLSLGDGPLIFRPLYIIWLDGLVRAIEEALDTDLPDARLFRNLCTRVWRNTHAPMHASTTVEAWAQQATGDHLRWETIGLIFSTIGLMLCGLSAGDGIFWRINRRATIQSMHGLVNECIAFLKRSNQLNDLLAVLLFQNALLAERATSDDGSSEAWLRMSEVCDTAIMLGLHKEKVEDLDTPFFLCELRIRLFNYIYAHDKFLSTYLGRPPRISYRHCAVQLPTDLSDHDACQTGVDLQVALAKIENGFNKSNSISRAGWRRAWSPQARIRENMLEIMLGLDMKSLDSHVENIRTSIKQARESLPPFATVDPVILLEITNRNYAIRSDILRSEGIRWRPLDLMMLVFIHCHILHTDFLLERAVASRNRTRQDFAPALISCAGRLLSLVLRTISKEDVFRDFQCDLTILVSKSFERALHPFSNNVVVGEAAQ